MNMGRSRDNDTGHQHDLYSNTENTNSDEYVHDIRITQSDVGLMAITEY
jgi:hypothetical protein